MGTSSSHRCLLNQKSSLHNLHIRTHRIFTNNHYRSYRTHHQLDGLALNVRLISTTRGMSTSTSNSSVGSLTKFPGLATMAVLRASQVLPGDFLGTQFRSGIRQRGRSVFKKEIEGPLPLRFLSRTSEARAIPGNRSFALRFPASPVPLSSLLSVLHSPIFTDRPTIFDWYSL